jgi:3-methylcrotonyl-CoA carboxylase beta subunit
MRELLKRLHRLETEVRQGGGLEKAEKQHAALKLTARERIAELQDPEAPFFETGLLVAYDRYDGQAPAAGVVTGLTRIERRPCVVVANDATVKAGAWWPETIAKILRAQEIAMRNRIPIVYLVDSAGVNLPLQDGIFPGQYGASRIFYYCSLMRGKLHIPQIAAVMGPSIAGGAYLPALSDVIVMVEGSGFMGLGGSHLVKGATGEVVDAESLGGAAMHTQTSGVGHYRASDDHDCLKQIRRLIAAQPEPRPIATGKPAALSAETLYELMPDDPRLPYDTEKLITALFDSDELIEFQREYATELLCAQARLMGRPVAIVANRRGFVKTAAGPRIGGIIYAESSRKAAYFVDYANRNGWPIIYLQDVTGFMVGTQSEREGIIRAGAEMVQAMACAEVPKITLTLGHASGAGYYAMGGQGFDPSFTLSWPTARIGVMEGEAAVYASFGTEIEKYRALGQELPENLNERIRKTRADYEQWLDSVHGAARGHVDAVINPAETREILGFLLEASARSAS